MEKQLTVRYNIQSLIHAVNIFRFSEDYSQNARILAYRYLFQYRGEVPRICPSKKEIVTDMINLFNKIARERGDTQFLFEIADILHTYSPNDGNRLLEAIRTLQENNTVPHIGNGGNRVNNYHRENKRKNNRTVYSDSQNVHDSSINQSVLKASKNLYALYKDIIKASGKNLTENIIQIIQKNAPHCSKVEKSMKYIKQSVATFGIGISLPDVFGAVWLWIHDQKKEVINSLEKRFVEELREMSGLCSTGHLARLVSIIQGYTDDEKFLIRIANKDQAKAVVRNFLTKKLASCQDEEILNGITEGTEKYVKFVRKSVAEKLLEWRLDYGSDFLISIAKIINDFSGTNVYTF